MTNPTDDVFDILGIPTREDSYTDLLYHALKRLPDFRRKLVGRVEESWSDTPDAHWQVLLRRPFQTMRLTSPSVGEFPAKLQPDLLLVAKSHGRAIFIENKIHDVANENQQRYYPEEEFHRHIAQKLGFEYSEPARCVYLTLDGTPLPGFKSIEHSDLADLLGNLSPDDNLKRLLCEYQQRVRHFKTWWDEPLPKVSLAQFSAPRQLVREEDLFLRLIKEFKSCDPRLVEHDRMTNGNNGYGVDWYCCLWRGADHWLGKRFDDPEQAQGNFKVLITLRWRCSGGDPRLSLEVQYFFASTTWDRTRLPKDCPAPFKDVYIAGRDRFRGALSLDVPPWSSRKHDGMYAVASLDFDPHLLVPEVVSSLELRVPEAVEKIESALKSFGA